MKRDHIGFFIFLTCLLIAPEISLGGFFNLPGRSNMSLGIVGLILWAILSPKHLTKVVRRFYYTPTFGLVIFSIYSFIVSIVSQNLSSILYAGQYLLYAILVFHMLSGYLWEAAKHDQMLILSRIVITIGWVVIFGTIASALLGPIYPNQTFWAVRKVGDVWIQRAVGFSGNPNAAAGILLILIPISLSLLPRTAKLQRFILVVLGATAVLATFSRSAILSGVVAICALLVVRILKVLILGKVRFKVSNIVIITTGMVIFILFIMFLPTIPSIEPLLDKLFGALGIGTIAEEVGERFRIWNASYSEWTVASLAQQLFGAGFRAGTEVSIYGTLMTPHNSYIEMLLDFGIVGLSIFVFPLVLTILRTLSRSLTFSQTNIEDMVVVGLLASGIHNMSETFFYSPTMLSLILLLMFLFEVRLAVDNKVKINQQTAAPCRAKNCISQVNERSTL